MWIITAIDGKRCIDIFIRIVIDNNRTVYLTNVIYLSS